MSKPFIVLGAGGHAKVVVDLLLSMGMTVLGLCDPDATLKDQQVLSVSILGGDEVLMDFRPDEINLAMGIGAFGSNLTDALKFRGQLFERMLERGFEFPALFHPSVIMGRNVILEPGVQVMAGSVLQPGCRIGALSIINTKVSIDHDCFLEQGVHLGPGATLGGGVKIGEYSYIGLGASVIHLISIGSQTTVGAGTVVINDVKTKETVMGVPARVKN